MSGLSARTSTTAQLRIEVATSSDALRFLSDTVRTFLEVGMGLRADSPEAVRVRLAVTEALTNVARHGYPGGEPGPLVLELSREGSDLVAVVIDHGVPFDPTRDGDTSIPGADQLAEGGYGLGIMREAMDRLHHSHTPDEGNRFTLRKKLWE